MRATFCKIKRETINLLTIVVIVFLNEHVLEAVVRSDETVGNKCNRVKGHGKVYANDVIKK